jgi:hypothetical protein
MHKLRGKVAPDVRIWQLRAILTKLLSKQPCEYNSLLIPFLKALALIVCRIDKQKKEKKISRLLPELSYNPYQD